MENRYDVRASEKIFECGDLVWLYNLACVAGALGGGFGTGEVWNGESKKREKLDEASAREEKRARERWEGRKIKRLPENHMFLHLSRSPVNVKS